jgi:hypothetical protein
MALEVLPRILKDAATLGLNIPLLYQYMDHYP